MRTVMNYSGVIAAWIEQKQDHARTKKVSYGHSSGGSGSRMFFNDDTIYSYGNHYPIARLLDNTRGDRIALLNGVRYSMTTSSHQRGVANALDRAGIAAVTLPDDLDHTQYIEDDEDLQITLLATIRDQIEQNLRGIGLATSDWSRERSADRLTNNIQDHNRIAAFFELPDKIELPADITPIVEAAGRRASCERTHRARRNAIKGRETRKNRDNDRNRWRIGLLPINALVNNLVFQSSYLVRPSRATQDNPMIEASNGHAFPLDEFLYGFLLAASCRDRATPYRYERGQIEHRFAGGVIAEITARGDIVVPILGEKATRHARVRNAWHRQTFLWSEINRLASLFKEPCEPLVFQSAA